MTGSARRATSDLPMQRSLIRRHSGLVVRMSRAAACALLLAMTAVVHAQDHSLLSDPVASAHAEGMYQRYCALCHGSEREGHAADHAPSLRSKSLMATASPGFLYVTTVYGRPGTAMAAYGEDQSGPLTRQDIWLLMRWLFEKAAVEPIELPQGPVLGDMALGARIYARDCAECHGANGEGVSGPALGNPMLLAEASDAFLRHAIAEGRDGTPMPAYRDTLTAAEIDGVTAWLRSRASGWSRPEPLRVSPPTPDRYVINPDAGHPEFELREGRFVAASAVREALEQGKRMVILDARAMSDWQRAHIPGAVPMPYYTDPDRVSAGMPDDGTWILVYCACPHAASGRVVDMLRAQGFPRTAVIDEGIIVWTQRGYPIAGGQ